VIPTRDRPDALDRCLASVANLDYPPFEVLVVDNASSSGRTREVVEAWSDRHPSIFYLREDRPGSSRARNAGIWQARTPIVAFTDDDVEVDRHWLRHIAAAFSQEGVVCATGLVWPASLDSAAEQWFEEYGGFGKGCEPRLWDLDQHRGAGPLYPYTVGAYGSGNNVAFSTDFLLRVGGYDSALGPGTAARAGEDLDLFLRAILSGHRIAYSPSAIVVHHHRTDPRALRAQLAAYGIGISAVLSKWAMRDPSDVLRRIPEGTRTLVSRSSDKNAGKKPTYPGRLQLAEWGGMVRGPAAYWRSSRRRADTGPRLTIAALPE
jgi:GT2 family glycosyltransferase